MNLKILQYLFKALRKNKIYLVIFLSLSIYFSYEFQYFNNWDLIQRIANANFLFRNGNYFYINFAPLEEFVIGIFSVILGNYAIYAFFAFFSFLLLFSIYLLSKEIKINKYYLLVILSPFLIFDGIKNGTEIPVISFLILTLYFSIRRNVLAGLTLGLAFLSKFYALFFIPLLLLGLGKDWRKSIRFLLLSTLLFLIVLLPYLFFMYELTGYSFAAVALAYWETEGLSINYGSFLFASVEYIPAIILIVIGYKTFKKNIIRHKKEAVAILLAFIISFYVGLLASKLALPSSSNVFRFILPSSTFLLILASYSIKSRYEVAIYVAASFIIAIWLLYIPSIITLLKTSSGFINLQYDAYKAAFNNSKCIVQLSDWVYLDYKDIPAIPIVTNDSVYPVLNYSKQGFVVHGKECIQGKVLMGTDVVEILQNNKTTYWMDLVGKYEMYNSSVFNPCGFAFKQSIMYSICRLPDYIFSRI